MARVDDEPIIPMDLANMRAHGVRSLDVMCAACRHETIVNVGGHAGADVRPNWLEHRPPRVGDVTSRADCVRTRRRAGRVVYPLELRQGAGTAAFASCGQTVEGRWVGDGLKAASAVRPK